MQEFIEGRARLVRMLAHKADPFTKDRLLRLAKQYDEQLGLGSLSSDDARDDEAASQGESHADGEVNDYCV
jgi:hypothetical protein